MKRPMRQLTFLCCGTLACLWMVSAPDVLAQKIPNAPEAEKLLLETPLKTRPFHRVYSGAREMQASGELEATKNELMRQLKTLPAGRDEQTSAERKRLLHILGQLNKASGAGVRDEVLIEIHVENSKKWFVRKTIHGEKGTQVSSFLAPGDGRVYRDDPSHRILFVDDNSAFWMNKALDFLPDFQALDAFSTKARMKSLGQDAEGRFVFYLDLTRKDVNPTVAITFDPETGAVFRYLVTAGGKPLLSIEEKEGAITYESSGFMTGESLEKADYKLINPKDSEWFKHIEWNPLVPEGYEVQIESEGRIESLPAHSLSGKRLLDIRMPPRQELPSTIWTPFEAKPRPLPKD